MHFAASAREVLRCALRAFLGVKAMAQLRLKCFLWYTERNLRPLAASVLRKTEGGAPHEAVIVARGEIADFRHCLTRTLRTNRVIFRRSECPVQTPPRQRVMSLSAPIETVSA
jgi:hypothetical protein